MSSNSYQIVDEGASRSYFSQIPNVIYTLFLTVDLLGFYGYLKRIAGEHGACWKSVPQMAKDLRCSENKIRQMKRDLQKPIAALDNLPLIKMHTGRKKADRNNLPDTVTITDIWAINFKILSTGSKSEPPLVQNLNQTGSKSEPKEEPFKKNPLEEDKNKQKEQDAAKAADVLPSSFDESKGKFSPEVSEICSKMIEAMTEIKPDKANSPPTRAPMRMAVDLMLRLDKRTPQKLLAVFRWALADGFWCSKMFKPNPAAYLRKQFDQLEMQMISKPSNHKSDRRMDKSGDSEYAKLF